MGDVHYIRPTLDPRSPLDKAFAPPWFEDVYRLEKLWRWLVFRDLRPKDPGYFIGHALDYREEYSAMCLWTGEQE